jgi:hypothetical protein
VREWFVDNKVPEMDWQAQLRPKHVVRKESEGIVREVRVLLCVKCSNATGCLNTIFGSEYNFVKCNNVHENSGNVWFLPQFQIV